jgi:hypothetical protein
MTATQTLVENTTAQMEPFLAESAMMMGQTHFIAALVPVLINSVTRTLTSVLSGTHQIRRRLTMIAMSKVSARIMTELTVSTAVNAVLDFLGTDTIQKDVLAVKGVLNAPFVRRVTKLTSLRSAVRLWITRALISTSVLSTVTIVMSKPTVMTLKVLTVAPAIFLPTEMVISGQVWVASDATGMVDATNAMSA